MYILKFLLLRKIYVYLLCILFCILLCLLNNIFWKTDHIYFAPIFKFYFFTATSSLCRCTTDIQPLPCVWAFGLFLVFCNYKHAVVNILVHMYFYTVKSVPSG